MAKNHPYVQTVYVAHVSHNFGDNYDVATTRERASQIVYDYVKENWHAAMGEMPADQDEAVTRYFELADGEGYAVVETDLDETRVPPAKPVLPPEGSHIRVTVARQGPPYPLTYTGILDYANPFGVGCIASIKLDPEFAAVIHAVSVNDEHPDVIGIMDTDTIEVIP